MNFRPSSLPANCSKFGISDSSDESVNLRRANRVRIPRIFNGGSRPVGILRRSDSSPNLASVLSPERPRTINSSTIVSPEQSPPQSGISLQWEMIEEHVGEDGKDGATIIHADTTMLVECQNEVIRFYRWCLTLIGWCPNTTMRGTIFNILWTMFIIICLFISYTYQIIVCQWDVPQKSLHNSTRNSSKMIRLEPAQSIDRKTALCTHLISLYLLPNFLHFIAYVIGCWHFRTKHEQVEALTQKLFMHYPSSSKRRFIRYLRIFFYFVLVWAVFSVIGNLVYDFLSGTQKSCRSVSNVPSTCLIVSIVEVMGNFFSFLVTAIVAFNFMAQGEIVIANISGLLLKIQMRIVSLRDAMKDVCNLKRNVMLLNGAPSLMMSILIFTTANLCLAGALMLTELNPDMLYNLYFCLFVLRFLPIALFPVMQIVRVNKFCDRLLDVALDVRANGYLEASQLDRDSFLLFSHTNQFTAKLFWVGFRGAHITLLAVCLILVIVILVQTGFLEWPF